MNRFSYRLSSLASIGASRLRGFSYLLFSCFILSSIGFSQTVSDIDGNVYQTVEIGDKNLEKIILDDIKKLENKE